MKIKTKDDTMMRNGQRKIYKRRTMSGTKTNTKTETRKFFIKGRENKEI